MVDASPERETQHFPAEMVADHSHIPTLTPLSNPPHHLEPGIESHGHNHAHHSHVHSEESLRALVNRLSRIEGHIRGIKTMVQDGRDCPDVLVQIAAVRGALDRVARMILDEHLTECLLRAAKAGNIESEVEALRAALDRFLP